MKNDQNSFYKNIYVFLFFRMGLNFCGVWDTDGRRQGQTKTDCYNFSFSWP